MIVIFILDMSYYVAQAGTSSQGSVLCLFVCFLPLPPE